MGKALVYHREAVSVGPMHRGEIDSVVL